MVRNGCRVNRGQRPPLVKAKTNTGKPKMPFEWEENEPASLEVILTKYFPNEKFLNELFQHFYLNFCYTS